MRLLRPHQLVPNLWRKFQLLLLVAHNRLPRLLTPRWKHGRAGRASQNIGGEVGGVADQVADFFETEIFTARCLSVLRNVFDALPKLVLSYH